MILLFTLTIISVYLSIYLLTLRKGMYTTSISLNSFQPILSIYISTYLSIYLSICLSIYLSVYLSICLSIYLSIYLSICLSIYLSICLYIYLSIYLSVHISIFLSIIYLLTLEKGRYTTSMSSYSKGFHPILSIYLSTYLFIYLSIYEPWKREGIQLPCLHILKDSTQF